jgi:hypothetical protein
MLDKLTIKQFIAPLDDLQRTTSGTHHRLKTAAIRNEGFAAFG